MENDSALRAELQVAMRAADSQIRGLNVLGKVVSAPASSAVGSQITSRVRRRELIAALLAAFEAIDTALAALLADGYPDMPRPDVNSGVLDEVQGKENDFVSAAEIFGATSSSTQDQATIDKIDVGMKDNRAAINQAMQP